MPSKNKFKFLDHTADIKFQAYGKTLEETYENSALALFNSIYDKKVKQTKKIKFNVKGRDMENLMYNFLEEFVFLFDAKHFLPSKVKVKIDKTRKKNEAEVYGDSSEDYDIQMQIKAVTYNDMFIKKQGNKWISQVVLDI